MIIDGSEASLLKHNDIQENENAYNCLVTRRRCCAVTVDSFSSIYSDVQCENNDDEASVSAVSEALFEFSPYDSTTPVVTFQNMVFRNIKIGSLTSLISCP